MMAYDRDTSGDGSLAPPPLACHPTPATRSRTLRFTCHRKPERGTSGGWRRSGASVC